MRLAPPMSHALTASAASGHDPPLPKFLCIVPSRTSANTLWNPSVLAFSVIVTSRMHWPAAKSLSLHVGGGGGGGELLAAACNATSAT